MDEEENEVEAKEVSERKLHFFFKAARQRKGHTKKHSLSLSLSLHRPVEGRPDAAKALFPPTYGLCELREE